MTKRRRLAIRWVPIDEVKAAAYNPRLDLQPGDPDYEKIRASLDRWDLVEPLVWNKRSGNLVGGHQRLKVLRARGDKEVPVVPVDLGPAEERALNLALNRVQGDWDDDKLVAVLQELAAQPNVPLAATGFDDREITQMLVEAQLAAGAAELKPVETLRPPRMTWALVGVPTSRLPEIAGHLEALAAIPGVFCELTANDGESAGNEQDREQ